MPPQSHDKIAEELEKALGTPYNRGEGVDFKKKGMAAEVEPTPETFTDGIRQLRPYKGRRYLVTAPTYTEEAVQRVRKTKIGIMKPNGTIIKPATPSRHKKR